MKSIIFIIIFSTLPLWSQVYDIQPDISTCTQGEISQITRDSILNLINQIRAIHKLNPVKWNGYGENLAQSASLSMANSGIMSHSPVNDNCATIASDSGRAYSNLSLGEYSSRDMSKFDNIFNSKTTILGWLIDSKNVAELSMVGHRRMLLSPFIQSIGYGCAYANLTSRKARFAAALWGNCVENLSVSTSINNYIAYPYEEYKSEWFNKAFYLSLNLIPKSNTPLTSISYDFSKCKISIIDGKGRKYRTHSIKYSIKNGNVDTFYCGLSNNLCWKVSGLKDNTKYFVTISGLIFDGEEQTIGYWFILNKPTLSEVTRKRRR